MRVMSFVVALSAILFGVAPAVWGQGVGGNSPTYTEHLLAQVGSIPEDPVDLLARVGSSQNPVPVELDPSGPPWFASFRTETGLPIFPGQTSLIDEYLSIQGPLPWRGWQMEILTGNFQWSTGWPSPAFDVRVNGAPAPGLNVELAGSVARASFEPLVPGTLVEISARIFYQGTTVFREPLQVRQYPTPEPTTLLGFFMLFPLIRRR